MSQTVYYLITYSITGFSFFGAAYAITCLFNARKRVKVIYAIIISIAVLSASIYMDSRTVVPSIIDVPYSSAIIILEEHSLDYLVIDNEGNPIEKVNPSSLVRLADVNRAGEYTDKGATIALTITAIYDDTLSSDSSIIEENKTPTGCSVPYESDYNANFIINDIEPGSDYVYYSSFDFDELSDEQINDLDFTMEIRAGSYVSSDSNQIENYGDDLYFEVEGRYFNFYAPELTAGTYTIFIKANDDNTNFFSYKQFEIE